jgi:hypothetical protein
MYCPECLTEYRDGFVTCADCQVALVAELPPTPGGEPEVRLVTVLEMRDLFALSLAKAALDEAGIDFVVTGDQPLSFPGVAPASIGQPPPGNYRCQIQVLPELEAEARSLLEPLQNPNQE